LSEEKATMYFYRLHIRMEDDVVFHISLMSKTFVQCPMAYLLEYSKASPEYRVLGMAIFQGHR
jgi:hypothetical protein